MVTHRIDLGAENFIPRLAGIADPGSNSATEENNKKQVVVLRMTRLWEWPGQGMVLYLLYTMGYKGQDKHRY